jgi:hypothetical protein
VGSWGHPKTGISFLVTPDIASLISVHLLEWATEPEYFQGLDTIDSDIDNG